MIIFFKKNEMKFFFFLQLKKIFFNDHAETCIIPGKIQDVFFLRWLISMLI